MSSQTVKRAYKFRFYPTDQQRELLNRTFGSVRYVYNRALAERHRGWFQDSKRIGFAETCRMLTAWKQEPDTVWLQEVSNVALQQGLQNLQRAYLNFWGKRAKYPTFKSKRKSRASATFTTSGFAYRDGQIKLAKTDGPLNIVWSRPLPEESAPSTVTVSRDAADRWHISILVEETIETLPPSSRQVGLDAGITSLVPCQATFALP
ncbi:MAG: transposase [Longispora sp.]|nr:transposase [Longispora sp. (in: high G+C Gram-positive bacteria)]